MGGFERRRHGKGNGKGKGKLWKEVNETEEQKNPNKALEVLCCQVKELMVDKEERDRLRERVTVLEKDMMALNFTVSSLQEENKQLKLQVNQLTTEVEATNVQRRARLEVSQKEWKAKVGTTPTDRNQIEVRYTPTETSSAKARRQRHLDFLKQSQARRQGHLDFLKHIEDIRKEARMVREKVNEPSAQVEGLDQTPIDESTFLNSDTGDSRTLDLAKVKSVARLPAHGFWPVQNVLLLSHPLRWVLLRRAAAAAITPSGPSIANGDEELDRNSEVASGLRDTDSEDPSEITCRSSSCSDESDSDDADEESIPGKLCQKALRELGDACLVRNRNSGLFYYK